MSDFKQEHNSRLLVGRCIDPPSSSGFLLVMSQNVTGWAEQYSEEEQTAF